jgi:hypothetical protein
LFGLQPNGPRLSFFFFAKKFFRGVRTRGDTNEVERANILAPGFWSGNRRTHLLPAFTADSRRTIGSWEVVSSYSSATAPDSHGISRADPLIKLAKNCRQK